MARSAKGVGLAVAWSGGEAVGGPCARVRPAGAPPVTTPPEPAPDPARAALAEERFCLAFEHAPTGMALVAPDGRWLRVNRALCEILGRDEAELLATSFQDVTHPEDLDADLALVADVLAGRRRAYVLEKRYLRADGSEVPILLSVSLVRDPEGRPLHFVSHVQDLTERKRESEARLERALDAAQMGSWDVDAATGKMRWDERHARLFGVEPGLFGEPYRAFLERVHPDDRAAVGATAVGALRAGGSWEQEFRAVWPDGTVRWILARGEATGGAGRPTRMVGMAVDVTERREAEAERARRHERERAVAERARRVQGVTVALSEALTVEQVTTVMGRHVRSALGAAGLVLSLVEGGDRLRVAWVEGYDESVYEAVGDLAVDAELPLAQVVKRRAPLFYDSPEAYLDGHPERAELLRLSGKRAWAFLPLVVSGRAVGSLGVGFSAERRFADEERALLATLAGACAQALERARLYEQERDTARALQRNLLPSRLPELSEASVAARYRPSGDGAEAGGDWYEVLALPGGGVGVAIGDVAGHGTRAAAVMGHLRNALRAYAVEGHPPAGVVERANRFLTALEPGEMATCCYLEFHPQDGTATVVRAGHPLPLLVQPGRAAVLVDVGGGLPFGVDAGAAYAETTVLLPPGARLVLYTDGLVESAALPLTEGLDRLVAAASACAGAGSEALADHLLSVLGAGEACDDVALLVLRYEPASVAPEHHVRRRLPPDPASPGAARRFAADVLAQWGGDELADTVALLVSELVTNAVLHTAADVELCLCLELELLRVEVVDESGRPPERREADDEATSGRGLFIVDALADAWGVEPRGAGKAVWFELARTP